MAARLPRSSTRSAIMRWSCCSGCRWAREQGAAEALGIDVSEKMLARARADTNDRAITYQRADMESLALPHEAFDVVYSSLALHYIADAGRLIAEAYRSLVRGGS